MRGVSGTYCYAIPVTPDRSLDIFIPQGHDALRGTSEEGPWGSASFAQGHSMLLRQHAMLPPWPLPPISPDHGWEDEKFPACPFRKWETTQSLFSVVKLSGTDFPKTLWRWSTVSERWEWKMVIKSHLKLSQHLSPSLAGPRCPCVTVEARMVLLLAVASGPVHLPESSLRH